jgi:hypothetical protein
MQIRRGDYEIRMRLESTKADIRDEGKGAGKERSFSMLMGVGALNSLSDLIG